MSFAVSRRVVVIFFGVILLGSAIFFYQKRALHGLPIEHSSLDMLAGKKNIVPVAIIGSGPAGLSAALYAARGGYHTVVFEGRAAGGQLMTTTWVENWPGIQKKMGPDIIKGLRSQAQTFGAIIASDAVTRVDFSSWPYQLFTEDGDSIYALTVIIATGAAPRLLNIPGEREFWAKGVTTCAICDAPFYKNSDVIVIGGGDSAAEEALQLVPYARSITLLVRSGKMRAAAAMQERVRAVPSIHVVYNAVPQRIIGDTHVTALEALVDGTLKTFPVEGIFLAIGHVPATDIFKEFLTCDDLGYLTHASHTQETSKRGIYVAGDVTDHRYRQAGVAAGDGIKAALDASEFLRDLGFVDAVAARYTRKLYEPSSGEQGSVALVEGTAAFRHAVLESEEPVIVEFFTENCPSCVQLLPVISWVVGQLGGAVKAVKVNATTNKAIAEEYAVAKVPTLIIFRDGKIAVRQKDPLSKRELLALVKQVLE